MQFRFPPMPKGSGARPGESAIDAADLEAEVAPVVVNGLSPKWTRQTVGDRIDTWRSKTGFLWPRGVAPGEFHTSEPETFSGFDAFVDNLGVELRPATRGFSREAAMPFRIDAQRRPVVDQRIVGLPHDGAKAHVPAHGDNVHMHTFNDFASGADLESLRSQVKEDPDRIILVTGPGGAVYLYGTPEGLKRKTPYGTQQGAQIYRGIDEKGRITWGPNPNEGEATGLYGVQIRPPRSGGENKE